MQYKITSNSCEKKTKFVSQLVMTNCICSFQCTVGKSSHLHCTSITLSASPFTLIPGSPPYRVLFVVRRKGVRGGKVVQTKEKGRIAAFKEGVRRGRKWPLCDGGGKRRGTAISIRRRMQGEDCWFLRRSTGWRTEQTVLWLLIEDVFVVLSPLTTKRSPTVLTEWEFLLHTCTSPSRADMSHVEVDHVLCIGPLDRDGKGFKRMESKGNQASHCVVNWPSQQACLDLKLQQARVPCVKPGGWGRDTESSFIKIYVLSSLCFLKASGPLIKIHVATSPREVSEECHNSYRSR